MGVCDMLCVMLRNILRGVICGVLCDVMCGGAGKCMATWKGEFKLPWRKADLLNHRDDEVDSD